MLARVNAAFRLSAALLARLGLVDRHRGERAIDLAWPRMLTGLARISQRTADLVMVGIAVGAAGIAGLAFAFPYWSASAALSSGLTNGAIGLISQRYGAERFDALDLAIKGTVWASLVLAVPITVLFLALPTELVALLGAEGASLRHGTTYLGVVALSVPFEFLNKASSRALLGVDDSVTPMVLRSGGALANIVLNAVLIFGFDLGVLGAALGTVIATALVTMSFAWGFLVGSFPGIGRFPVTLDPRPPHVETTFVRQLIEVTTPLMIRGLAGRAALFPLVLIVAEFGTATVAAYEISRRVRSLLNTPMWGFSKAANSLVGQALGGGDEAEAEAYSGDVLRFSLVFLLAVSVPAFLLARPIAGAFVDDPETIARAVPFIRAAAIGTVALGLDGVATGTLTAGGDTRWPLYGRLVGLYLVTLPVAYLGLVTPLGVFALYLAIIAETAVPAAVTLYRLRTGRWMAISRTYRPDPSD